VESYVEDTAGVGSSMIDNFGSYLEEPEPDNMPVGEEEDIVRCPSMNQSAHKSRRSNTF
jgi:hypothetical protein